MKFAINCFMTEGVDLGVDLDLGTFTEEILSGKLHFLYSFLIISGNIEVN